MDPSREGRKLKEERRKTEKPSTETAGRTEMGKGSVEWRGRERETK